jgi:hypothetical protein
MGLGGPNTAERSGTGRSLLERPLLFKDLERRGELSRCHC